MTKIGTETDAESTTLGIVGANSQVGTELCFIYDSEGYDVIPIVRSRVAASTFEEYGFDFKVGNIAYEENAEDIVPELDIVIIAAFAPWFGGLLPKEAREINESIIQNAVNFAAEGTTLVYFSTMNAFGGQYAGSNWNWYTREKRRFESLFRDLTESTSVSGYILRLGAVFGKIQEFTKTLVEVLSSRDRIHIPVSQNQLSNVAHTVTVAEAIQECHHGSVAPGRYTVVNEPQWSWLEVLEYYAPSGTRLVFEGQPTSGENRPFVSGVVQELASLLKEFRASLVSGLVYAPDWLATYINQRRLDAELEDSVTSFQERSHFDWELFGYDPVPGPYVPNLSKTLTLLENCRNSSMFY